MDKPIFDGFDGFDGFDREKIFGEFGGDAAKLKKYLRLAMNAEVKKSASKMNPDKIAGCADWLLELDGTGTGTEPVAPAIPSVEEIRLRAKSAAALHYKPRKNSGKRLAALKIAAVCAAFLLCVQLILYAAFHVDVIGGAYNMIANNSRFFIPESVDADATEDLTQLVRSYDTVEDFQNSENISVVVPGYLPCNEIIDEVQYYPEDNVVGVIFTDGAELEIRICSWDMDEEKTENAEVYEYNGIKYYMADNYLVWKFDGDVYYLTCEYMEENFETIIKDVDLQQTLLEDLRAGKY